MFHALWNLIKPKTAPDTNELAGRPLRYLIGASGYLDGHPEDVTELPYDVTLKPKHGLGIKYGNLFDEENTGKFAPYIRDTDTSKDYHEGRIDPKGQGWNKNLTLQFVRAVDQGYEYIELDNADSYPLDVVLKATDLAYNGYNLKVIAKNPLLVQPDSVEWVAHKGVAGIIVESGAGEPVGMDKLRQRAWKPHLPIWYVAFGDGYGWAKRVSFYAKNYIYMGVTYSSVGEYCNYVDLTKPNG